ncbi:MAG: hypothetical protein JXX14_01720 [Deltaproteobacteria bacterium]|nr:hypothetical protein [Deltaproteobacteria bacterium]
MSSIACQTQPITYLAPSTEDTETVDTETHYYVLNPDSEIVDWHYDTADGTGGPDESCYTRTGENGEVVWCDNPELIAQQCASSPSGCCCRQSCAPARCTSASGETAVCSHFDLAQPLGYCSLNQDAEPVTYTCAETCTPRSECVNIAVDGSCLDSDAPQNGLCLLYDLDTEVRKCCQKSCEMVFCDSQHMCVPLYDAGGQMTKHGACEPIVQ